MKTEVPIGYSYKKEIDGNEGGNKKENAVNEFFQQQSTQSDVSHASLLTADVEEDLGLNALFSNI